MKFETFSGTGKVFRFTLAQLLKSKANIRALVIVLLMGLCSAPLLSLIRGGGSGKSEPSAVYVDNQSGLSLEGLEAYLKDAGLGDVTVKIGLPEKPEKEAALRLAKGQNGLSIEIAGDASRS